MALSAPQHILTRLAFNAAPALSRTHRRFSSSPAGDSSQTQAQTPEASPDSAPQEPAQQQQPEHQQQQRPQVPGPDRATMLAAAIADVQQKIVLNTALQHDDDLSSEIGIVPELQRQQENTLKLLLARRRLDMQKRLLQRPAGMSLMQIVAAMNNAHR